MQCLDTRVLRSYKYDLLGVNNRNYLVFNNGGCKNTIKNRASEGASEVNDRIFQVSLLKRESTV